MGRKKIDKNKLRDRKITIRITENEQKQINKIAKKLELNKSDFIRTILLNMANSKELLDITLDKNKEEIIELGKKEAKIAILEAIKYGNFFGNKQQTLKEYLEEKKIEEAILEKELKIT